MKIDQSTKQPHRVTHPPCRFIIKGECAGSMDRLTDLCDMNTNQRVTNAHAAWDNTQSSSPHDPLSGAAAFFLIVYLDRRWLRDVYGVYIFQAIQPFSWCATFSKFATARGSCNDPVFIRTARLPPLETELKFPFWWSMSDDFWTSCCVDIFGCS